MIKADKQNIISRARDALGLFKVNVDGKTIEIHRKEFSSERSLEDLIQKNPEIILEQEPLLIIGRQVSTDLGSVIDLLGISTSGNTVSTRENNKKALSDSNSALTRKF